MAFAPQRRIRPTGQAEARLIERDKLTAAYKRDRRERIKALCDGPQGEHIKELVRFLKRMDFQSGRDLIARAEAAIWVRLLAPQDRVMLLGIVGGAIIHMREKAGLPAFEDPMPDQPANVFEQVKAVWGIR